MYFSSRSHSRLLIEFSGIGKSQQMCQNFQNISFTLKLLTMKSCNSPPEELFHHIVNSINVILSELVVYKYVRKLV